MIRQRLSVAVVLAAALAASLAAPAYAEGVTQGQNDRGSAAGGPWTFYVSPHGNDDGPGTHGYPFATVQRAQEAVRQHTSDMSRDIVVTVDDGTYRLDQSLVLGASDSGTNGHAVVWRAAPGARPILSGGRQISGWQLSDAANGIYRAKAMGLETRQLYVNGRRATRARSDVTGSDFTKTATGYTVTGTDAQVLSSLTHPGDVEIQSNVDWMGYRCGIDSVTTQGATAQVTMDQPCWMNANLRYYDAWNMGTPTSIDNAREFLNAPGEWYLDEQTGWLYYKPLSGERMSTANVIAPVLDTLVSAQGTAAAPVHDIRFEGLTFADATWLDPSTNEGYAVDQTGMRFTGTANPKNWGHGEVTTRTPGNLSFGYAHRIIFDRDVFTRLGAAGLDFNTGSQENIVENSRFEDISGAGIQIGGVLARDGHPPTAAQLTRDNRVSDSVITRIGQEYYDGPGIFVGYTTRTTIEHNSLSHLPYSGITIGWGWGLSDPGGHNKFPVSFTQGMSNAGWTVYSTPTASLGNRISANRFDDFMGTLVDGGAVYNLSQQGTSLDNGLVVDRNVATNQHHPYYTFYTDAGSRYVTFRDNVSATDIASWGGWMPYGDIRYEGNYWKVAGGYITPDTTGPGATPTNIQQVNNTTITGLDDAPSAIVNNAGPRQDPPAVP